MTLSGHRTSLALEPAFWDAVDEAARREGLSVAALLTRLDEARGATPLASAVRVAMLSRRT